MIRLSVEDYCHQCSDFIPDVTKPERSFVAGSDEIIQSDTIVQCSYRRRCEAIKKYLIRQAKEEAVG